MTTAQERITELEQYIKDSSTKFAICNETKLRQKEEEIEKLRQATLEATKDARRTTEALKAECAKHQQTVQVWEQGARRILAAAEKFSEPRGDDETGRSESNHFGRTATKLSLTLSSQSHIGSNGSDVESLQRLLRDAL